MGTASLLKFFQILGDKSDVRYVQMEEKEFWHCMDKHLPQAEFNNKVLNKTTLRKEYCKNNEKRN